MGTMGTKKIRKLTKSYEWRHVPGTCNPADVATRDANEKDLVPESLWFTGPKFLLLPKHQWPVTNIKMKDITVGTKRKVGSYVATIENKDKCDIRNVIPIQKFSDIYRLLRVTAYVMRFVNNMLAPKKGHNKSNGDLSVAEIQDAEFFF